jgi:DNA-binding NarL/FixJ family response regulator
MDRHIVVLSDIPVFRAGLEDALAGAGYLIEQPGDIVAWARAHGSRGTECGAFLPARLISDMGSVARLSRRAVRLIVVLAHPEPLLYAHALAAGAATAVDERADRGTFVDAMSLAFQGRSMLPLDTAEAIARAALAGISSKALPDVRWLRELADGATVASLAAEHGFSTRQMYRNLRELYSRVGASRRLEAIERAVQLGLI